MESHAPLPLPPDLLRRVVAKADQATRVACCVASKKLRHVLVHPVVWKNTSVYTIDDGVVDFLSRVTPEWLCICSTDVARLEWLLDGLLCGGVHITLRWLAIHLVNVCFPRPCTLAETLGEFPELTTLIIDMHGVREPACLAFSPDSSGLRKLQSLYVLEKIEPKMEVYLHDAHLPALERVVLQVATSDVLAHCRRFPGLRHVAYDSRAETYEDANLTHSRLSCMRVNVRDERALTYLVAALARARTLERLVLFLHGDMCLDEHVNARNVHLRLLPGVRRVELEYGAISDAWSLEVKSDDPFEVVFHGMGSWDTFVRWSRLTRLTIAAGGTVKVDPT